MPDIPFVPGVPPLLSYALNTAVLIAEDVASIFFSDLFPQWGIFLFGIPVIFADSTVSFEFRQDFPISDYPVEGGSFQSYDKVELPAEIRVRLSAGGSVINRQAFLASIDAVMSTTLLYDVVTPEKVYLDYNFTHRDFSRRSDNGNGLIVVDLWLTQVRQSVSSSFSNTQNPAEAGQQAIGNVQATPPSTPLSISLSNADPNRTQIQ